MSGTDASNPSPGFARTPGYRIRLAPAGRRMRVVIGCVTVAESDHALTMREADYPPVYYFPRDDVNMELMLPSGHGTHCPYKGDASYWTLADGEDREENVAWSYEAPYDEMRDIAGMIAFYQDRVTLEIA